MMVTGGVRHGQQEAVGVDVGHRGRGQVENVTEVTGGWATGLSGQSAGQATHCEAVGVQKPGTSVLDEGRESFDG